MFSLITSCLCCGLTSGVWVSFKSFPSLSFLLTFLALTDGGGRGGGGGGGVALMLFFFELSSILWAFAQLISHHIIISERISLGPGQRNTPASLAVGYNHLGDETRMAQADESYSRGTWRAILAGRRRHFPPPNQQSPWQAGFSLAFRFGQTLLWFNASFDCRKAGRSLLRNIYRAISAKCCCCC